MAIYFNKDNVRTVPPADAERCKMCGQRSPLELRPAYHMNAMQEQPNLAGWMRIVYPWSEISDACVRVEWANICPPCGKRTADFIAHIQHPELHDEDLL